MYNLQKRLLRVAFSRWSRFTRVTMCKMRVQGGLLQVVHEINKRYNLQKKVVKGGLLQVVKVYKRYNLKKGG